MMFLKKFPLWVILVVLALSGCFSPWKGEDGTGEARLTLVLGGNASSSRAAVDIPMDYDLTKLAYIVELSGATETVVINVKEGQTSIERTVAAGTWDIAVKGIRDGALYAVGSEKATLRPGQDNVVSLLLYETLAWKLAWLRDNAADGDEYAITIYTNESLDPQVLDYKGNDVKITLTGHNAERILSLDGNGSLFSVYTGVTLTLGNNITLRGHGKNDSAVVLVGANYPGDTDPGSGTLVMENGSKITGNTAPCGGGVDVRGMGIFTMTGGEISGNTASQYGGGGVNVAPTYNMAGEIIGGEPVFEMSGGTISDNSTDTNGGQDNSGGGVNVGSGGSFFMIGNAKIVNNTSARGGGVNMWRGQLTISDSAAISNNHAVFSTTMQNSGESGGVNTWESIVTMYGGEISWNTAAGQTGGIQIGGSSIETRGTLTMTGGKISNNTAKSGGGGGVYVNGHADLIMSGGEISNNTALNGGGVFLNPGATFTMGGGTISSNHAVDNGKGEGSGGGVDAGDGTFEMHGGIIEQNDARVGGGVQIYQGDFTMDGGFISNNEAGENGGGVHVESSGIFTMTTGDDNSFGTISGNTAKAGGGVKVFGGTFDMYDGKISGNTATEWGGGGVNISDGAQFTMNGNNALITGNISTGGAGGVNMGNNVTFTLTDGTITENHTDGQGGGVHAWGGGTVMFEMIGGTISDNTAGTDGGGVCMNQGTFKMTGGTISDNTAGTGGGGVHINSGAIFNRGNNVNISNNSPKNEHP